MSRSIALVALVLAGCSGELSTAEVGSALVGGPMVPGALCFLDQTACDATRTNLYVCGPPYNGGAGGGSGTPTQGIWDYDATCDGFCFTSQDSAGLEHDYCGCYPRDVKCQGGSMYRCDATGHWLYAGLCANHCPCGGVYPHCYQCP